jgi:pimeloyl-CoA dehydrogenase small subunit
MDFDFSEEQRLLKESVDRLVAGEYEFEKRRGYMREKEGWSRTLWKQYAEMGLLGLPFAEEHGGFGGGPVETMLVMESFGRGLIVEPYAATVILAGGALRHSGHAALLPKITGGEAIVALAHAEPQSRWNLADVRTTARKDGSAFVPEGEKALVLHGDSADELVVSARQGSRIDLFLVDAKAPGVSRRGYPTQDGQRAAEISLAGARAEALVAENALPIVERVADEAMAALCAEAVGAMAAMHELTVEYLKTRKQFGVSIGSFQALQHRAVDMLVEVEQARSMAMFATMMVQEKDPAERRKSVAAAKAQIGRSARFVGQQAVQLHGGIGMTAEYKLGAYFKRVTMIDTAFGNAEHQLQLLAKDGGLFFAA